MSFSARFVPLIRRVTFSWKSRPHANLFSVSRSFSNGWEDLNGAYEDFIAMGADEECYESPLDKILDPSAPTPLFNSTEFKKPPPPKRLECGVDESALRFKTKSFGRLHNAPFVHPNEHKVVMSVPFESLNLDNLEREIMKEIVGSRWREKEGELRLQSVSFGSRIENKRHLVSMLDRLVLSCQRLAAEVRPTPDKENETA